MAERALRDVFGEELRELGRENDKIVVLDADLSSTTRSALFGEEFPDRFFNVGIAEANMVSIAAGLSTCGFIPYVTTFGFLLALRSIDQIRSQICYPKLNVKLIGANAGLSGYGDGATHQTTTDLAIMGAMPNMHILVPSDSITLRWSLREAAAVDGPVYIRVPRVPAPTCHEERQTFNLGKCITHRIGVDVTIVATGLMTGVSLKAAEMLSGMGISASVLEMLTIKPFDREAIISQALTTGAFVTVEEHSRYGGLFSLVSETTAENCHVPVLPVSIEDRFGETGEYAQLLETCGLTVDHIIQQTCRAIEQK